MYNSLININFYNTILLHFYSSSSSTCSVPIMAIDMKYYSSFVSYFTI